MYNCQGPGTTVRRLDREISKVYQFELFADIFDMNFQRLTKLIINFCTLPSPDLVL
jgi:hypothetical protein